MKFADDEAVEYQWIDNDSGSIVTKREGQNNDYRAHIAPVVNGYLTTKRMSALKNEDFIKEYLRSEAQLNDQEKTTAMVKIHKALTKEPVHCDQCHKENGLLNFTELLYSPQFALYLESLDMGAMTEIYKEFYFPDLLKQ